MSQHDVATLVKGVGGMPEHDAELLSRLEDRTQAFRKGCMIWRAGEAPDHFLVVKQGCISAYRQLEDGSRQAVEVFLPGDIVGIGEIGFRSRLTDLVALSRTEVGVIPKSRLTETLTHSLAMCKLFLLMASQRHAILVERLVDLGRRSARQRIAHFLMESHTRLYADADLEDVAGDGGQDRQERRLPFSQVFLAELLGLSAVHVNRTLKELRAENVLECRFGGLRVLDPQGLRRIASFNEGYLEQDACPFFTPMRAVTG